MKTSRHSYIKRQNKKTRKKSTRNGNKQSQYGGASLDEIESYIDKHDAAEARLEAAMKSNNRKELQEAIEGARNIPWFTDKDIDQAEEALEKLKKSSGTAVEPVVQMAVDPSGAAAEPSNTPSWQLISEYAKSAATANTGHFTNLNEEFIKLGGNLESPLTANSEQAVKNLQQTYGDLVVINDRLYPKTRYIPTWSGYMGGMGEQAVRGAINPQNYDPQNAYTIYSEHKNGDQVIETMPLMAVFPPDEASEMDVDGAAENTPEIDNTTFTADTLRLIFQLMQNRLAIDASDEDLKRFIDFYIFMGEGGNIMIQPVRFIEDDTGSVGPSGERTAANLNQGRITREELEEGVGEIILEDGRTFSNLPNFITLLKRYINYLIYNSSLKEFIIETINKGENVIKLTLDFYLNRQMNTRGAIHKDSTPQSPAVYVHLTYKNPEPMTGPEVIPYSRIMSETNSCAMFYRPKIAPYGTIGFNDITNIHASPAGDDHSSRHPVGPYTPQFKIPDYDISTLHTRNQAKGTPGPDYSWINLTSEQQGSLTSADLGHVYAITPYERQDLIPMDRRTFLRVWWVLIPIWQFRHFLNNTESDNVLGDPMILFGDDYNDYEMAHTGNFLHKVGLEHSSPLILPNQTNTNMHTTSLDGSHTPGGAELYVANKAHEVIEPAYDEHVLHELALNFIENFVAVAIKCGVQSAGGSIKLLYP